jgi:NDP-sugar pyrophosphorylase family protein
VTGFGGFPDAAIKGGEHPPLMFTGIQVLSPRILEYVPKACFSHSTTDVYPRAIADGEAVIAHIAEGDWYEMSTLDRYLEASIRFLELEGRRRFVSGAGCMVDDSARIEESVLWDKVTVAKNASIRRSILADGVRVPEGFIVDHSAVVRRDSVQKIERGEVAGENLIVPI